MEVEAAVLELKSSAENYPKEPQLSNRLKYSYGICSPKYCALDSCEEAQQ